MLNRKYNLKLDLQFRCNNSNMEFNQFDKNTSDFFMQINRSGKEIDLSKALVTLMVIKPNGSVDSQFLEIDKNGVYANLKPSLKDIPGDYQCKAIITMKDETVIPEQIFTYTVNEDKFLAAFNSNMIANEDYSLLTDILGRLSNIETDEQQRQINEAERILSEEARQVSENARVEAELTREHNDADREKSEATRESNEHDRKLAEISRAKVELARVEAEDNRVDAEVLRVEAEKLRNDNYSFMTSDEERRRSEENSRIEAEKLRVQAEKARVNEESQRRTTEQSRVLKENERNSKELEREDNELERKSNESKRVQAESNRVDRYNNFINDAESATNSFKSYTSTAKQDEEIRKNNELARVESEDRRVSNELERISNENTRKANEGRRVEAENNRQSKFNSKISEVENKVIEVNVAKDTVIANTKEAINTMKEDVANAIAAGTQDLEVKEARKDLSGKTHESLKLRIASDFEGLKESQDMAYTTDKGYLVCKETKNGTIKDLKVSGKSLKNLSKTRVYNPVYSSEDSRRRRITDVIGNSFTISCNVKANNIANNIKLEIGLTGGTKAYPRITTGGVEQVCKYYSYDSGIEYIEIYVDQQNFTQDIDVNIDSIMILEGDHTQNPPSYFEGIASVGNGANKIEASSSNKNLFTSSLELGEILWGTGENVESQTGDKIRANDFIKVVSNTNYSINKDCVANVYFYDNNKKFIYPLTLGQSTTLFNTPGNCCYIKFRFLSSDLDFKYQLEIGEITEYVNPKQDKKTVLFKDTDGTWKPVKELRGLDTVCDTIELHDDGKYYYHQRTEKIVLSGSEDWKYNNSVGYFYLTGIPTNIKRSFLLCDKYVYGIISVEQNKIIAVGGAEKIQIKDSDFNSIEAFKQYLNSNNVTVIYQLAEGKVFEVNPLFLEAFESETMVSVNSGVVNASMEFKLTSSLPNLTRNLQLRIDNLENEIYKSQELQDIMLLENDLRLMDLEFALLESMPIKLNLRSDVMFAKGVTEFEFLKKRIESGSHTDEYLEKCINKYKKAGRLTDEEYDILYDMIYPPVYDVLADK